MTFAVFSVFLGFSALHRATWLSVSCYLGSVSMLALAAILAMGQPRPAWTFSHLPRHATLLAFQAQEPVALYLWLLPEGSSVPVAVELPWSEGAAMQQQMAAEQARLTHGRVQMQFVHGTPEFYASSITAMPTKGTGQ